ncbi:MAG: DNA recombination protein RmuC, partial [Anaerolineae bacterium]|nr:DNA recombination protein RmuC [Anaerolineae bacterium]
MDDFAALIDGLHGWSLFIGAVAGLVIGIGLFMLTRYNMKKTFQGALEAQKESFDSALNEMKSSFSSLSSEALTSSQQDFLNLANDKFEGQTERHENKLDEKEKLIDQQLGQMSDTLKEVPVKLVENQKNVSAVLDKSTEQLKESNQTYLNQLSEKADAQTKEHVSKLEDKETQINRTLGEMKDKLGKVEELIQGFEKARESKLGALDDQLKSLTATTSSLQRALADNRARGQWGERMAEDMLKFMGLVEGVNYIKQSVLDAGTKPDFTFLLPNEKSLNMDVKFPLDNYLHYFDAETDTERRSYSDKFLKDVNARVIEIRKRGYIGADTLDCVIISIPNEQIYRFIHEQNHQIIDDA